MVQRYIEGGYGASEMEEDAQGDWVSYEDYAALVNSVETLRDMIKVGHMRVEHVSGFLEGVFFLVAKE